ncbi:methylated-DNA--protein-cysteine methyltransferase [Zootermopsis nevadensis]|uniref:methylated-DNA--protein-cysteine methyltransferase n=1 Tax=Zootermopsis nevadensis TaxID=136037 RepID=UPI000B8E610C|nr:methylated-DNA--protein-cysteine methyltransferase [Zootermopsis nevadensis]
MVCLKSVEVFRFMSPIGEMFMKICSQGLHSLSQCDYICDINFNPQTGQGVFLTEKKSENNEVQKHVEACINWLNVYFSDVGSITCVHMPDICVATEMGSFQERVWVALAKNIGPGQIVSYGELAKMVNSPGASQAVGSAMAANPLQILVPCHRVIRSDGSVGQYSRGRKNSVKNWLLEHEGLKIVNKKVIALKRN